jgi:hypothetical protein
MRDGSTPRLVKAPKVLVTTVKTGGGIGSVGSPSKSGARKALRD